MPKFLTREWLELSRSLAGGQPTRRGVSARIQYVVTGGPDGDVSYIWTLDDGRLREAALGVADDADVTITETYDDAVMLAKGDLDTSVAFMQGRIKISGNMTKVMALLPLTSAPEYRKLQGRVKDRTEF